MEKTLDYSGFEDEAIIITEKDTWEMTDYISFMKEKYIKKNILKRKNGVPAFVHPLCVFDSLRGLKRTIRISALFHDAIEDGVLDREELWILPEESREIVLLLTREKNTPYLVYIFRICFNVEAIAVKIADIQENMSDGYASFKKQYILYPLAEKILRIAFHFHFPLFKIK